jgi:ABC-type ATPase involved in cell division/GNAT superfamily N-acetyltransferase
MPRIDVAVETRISTSVRAAQVSSMFDVPPEETARLEWHGEMPIEGREWNVGLIVGPSGSGKTTLLRETFGEPASFEWNGASVIDDFDTRHNVQEVASICQAVGFNTIPAWLRPYGVLSNGEKFRVDLARRLLEGGEQIACDEFTSVVDRQVARIGSHAVQKFIRKAGRRFVAATCHYDLEDWLQPDWVLEPATMTFRWRSVQRRPGVPCTIERRPHDAWATFARFHYLTADLHQNARCYVLSVDGAPAALAAVMFRPHPKVPNIYGMSRLVTLPDFQGLGLAFALADRVGSAYKALGWRYHSYPAHPSLIRSFDRSPMWALERKPMMQSTNRNASSTMSRGNLGGRPCAVFSYRGPAMDRDQAERLIGGDVGLMRRAGTLQSA